MFVTNTSVQNISPTSGYTLKPFIRGKPWLIEIDDVFLWNSGISQKGTSFLHLIFPFLKWFDPSKDDHYDIDGDVLRFAKVRDEE